MKELGKKPVFTVRLIKLLTQHIFVELAQRSSMMHKSAYRVGERETNLKNSKDTLIGCGILERGYNDTSFLRQSDGLTTEILTGF